jgi:hypothetical protein
LLAPSGQSNDALGPRGQSATTNASLFASNCARQVASLSLAKGTNLFRSKRTFIRILIDGIGDDLTG